MSANNPKRRHNISKANVYKKNVHALQKFPLLFKSLNDISRAVDHLYIWERFKSNAQSTGATCKLHLWACGVRAQIKDQLSCLSLHIDVDKNNSSVLQRVMVPGDDTVTEL